MGPDDTMPQKGLEAMGMVGGGDHGGAVEAGEARFSKGSPVETALA